MNIKRDSRHYLNLCCSYLDLKFDSSPDVIFRVTKNRYNYGDRPSAYIFENLIYYFIAKCKENEEVGVVQHSVARDCIMAESSFRKDCEL